ncbi:competence type IV pilus major pilin ComGC [Streptococcus thoraltensis]|uniref:competence type IV pilus major pilin ComGC n=1 Tax=Streptococcus thoraltensis TaxID=55085 RepID=UPI00036B9A39|nr:competence type IV pilus major pilin ComGC [Streptococcus thoraltensis]MDY4761783.1 competence type IV pilus major pilin ComGC [Streptococcus thoraltensis]
MKNYLEQVKRKSVKAFTLIEMLVVLLIISVLMLLFVPNLSKQKAAVDEKGQAAVVKVVESQMELYEMNKDVKPSVDQLVQEGYITQKQADTYAKAKH